MDIGQSTLFSETGMGGDRDFRGIGYVEPQGFPGVETKGVPCLAGILLKNDEAQIAWDLGLTRVTALLGMKYRYYPCPAWSDLKREPVATLHAMEKSHLWKITRIPARASYYEERKSMAVRHSNCSHKSLLVAIQDIQRNGAMSVIRLFLRLRANDKRCRNDELAFVVLSSASTCIRGIALLAHKPFSIYGVHPFDEIAFGFGCHRRFADAQYVAHSTEVLGQVDITDFVGLNA